MNQPRNIWRFFPWFVAMGLGTVIAVNLGLVYFALHTFPGNAGGDGFDLSNNYNHVLDRMEQQAALGWVTRAEVDGAGRPIVLLSSQSGSALSGADLHVMAARPVGDPHATDVRFSEVSPGRYVGVETLVEKGQWELRVSATAGGHRFNTTRRIIVR